MLNFIKEKGKMKSSQTLVYSIPRNVEKDTCAAAIKAYQYLISPPPSPIPNDKVASTVDVPKCSTIPESPKDSIVEPKPTATPVAQLHSKVYDLYRDSPKIWLRRERQWLQRHSPAYRFSTPAAKRPRRQPSSFLDVHASNTRKRGSPDTPDSGHSTPHSKGDVHPGMPQHNTRFKQSSREFSSNTQAIDVANTPYELLPDYSPDMSVLDKRSHPRPLRSEWKGPPLDLSNDENRHLLHPAELQLAATLRLPCLVYLDNKRRIFAEWHNRRTQGLSFRKTDAQRASRVDVNKASRLWKAFHDEGFFDD